MQHLGRANAVQNLDAEGVLPFLTQMRRQGLAGRDAKAQTRRIQSRHVAMMLEQHAINDRDAEEDSRSIFFEDIPDDFRRGLFAAQNRRASIQQRKREAVAEAVREWQTWRGKHAIIIPKLKNFTAEGFIGVEDVRLAVYRALWLSGAAWGVQDESIIIRIRFGWKRVNLLTRRSFEREHAQSRCGELIVFSSDEQAFKIGGRIKSFDQSSGHRPFYDCRTCAAILDDE